VIEDEVSVPVMVSV
jgi:hypothetical protein